MIQLPVAFAQQMQAQLQEDWPLFEGALGKEPPTSIRWNKNKASTTKEILAPVPWNSYATYLPTRPVFTLDPLLHAGVYYVQEASSMLIGAAIEQLIDGSKPIKALDLCAAPGGKTSLLADTLASNSLILANEVIKNRYYILQENLIKWGAPNVYFSNHDSTHLAQLKGFFDLIVVDAPCSGEGLFRKTPDATKEWSEDAVALCSSRQKRILAEAVEALAPGGFLIYCTCTYNDSENADNAKWLEKEFGLQPQQINLPLEWGVKAKELGYQAYLHRVNGEGFYFCCFQKKEGRPFEFSQKAKFKQWQALSKKQQAIVQAWLTLEKEVQLFVDPSNQVFAILKEHVAAITNLDQYLSRRLLGKHIGTIKGKDFIPSPTLALSQLLPPNFPRQELDLSQALKYLKRESFDLALQQQEGWQLVSYQTHPLGWIKGIKRRINNYYPKEWRIRMKI